MTSKISWTLTLFSLILAAAGLALVLNFTSPEQAGPPGILLIFAMIYLVSFVVIFTLWRVTAAIWRVFRAGKNTERHKLSVKSARRRRLLISAALAFSPLFLISLNSIGQLQLRDVFLIALIEVLAIFYIIKRT